MSKIVIEKIVLFLVVKSTTLLLSLMIRLVEEIVTLLIIKNMTTITTLVFVLMVGTIIL